MKNSPKLPIPAPPWRRYVFALAVVSLLGGCGTPNGDFGEVQPYLVNDHVHDWVGPYATGSVPSKFDLTDDERQLRDLSYPLIEAPYRRQQWYSVLGEYGVIRPDRARNIDLTYADRLLASRYHSALTRYSQLIDDISNDVTRMPQFFETASRVLDMDARRRKSMSYVSALSGAERKNAEQRMAENASIVATVHGKLAQRLASYRFALERLVIATPSPRAVEVEHGLNQMQSYIGRYRHPAPTWVREPSLVDSR